MARKPFILALSTHLEQPWKNMLKKVLWSIFWASSAKVSETINWNQASRILLITGRNWIRTTHYSSARGRNLGLQVNTLKCQSVFPLCSYYLSRWAIWIQKCIYFFYIFQYRHNLGGKKAIQGQSQYSQSHSWRTAHSYGQHLWLHLRRKVHLLNQHL